jgi:stage II sporulation protein D
MFCVILLTVALLPFAAAKAVKERPVTKLTIFEDGETKEIDAENYALRVLLGEGKICESLESKKALAVSARTLAVYFSLYGGKHEDFSACADGNCCLSLGNIEESDESFLEECKEALEATKGEALTFNGLPALTLFTLCSGSGTSENEDYPYLSPTSNSEICEKHKTVLSFEKSGVFENVTESNSCVVYTENNKCEFLILNGKKLDSIDFISQTGIKSPEFTLYFEDGNIRAEANGIGHGFGLDLCQAEKFAKSGKDYKEILGFYYPKLVLNKIY